MKLFLSNLVAAGALFLFGCVTVPPRVAPPPIVIGRAQALVRLSPEQIPSFEDDADTASLHTAILQSAAYYRQLPPTQSYVITSDTYTARELSESMVSFAALLEKSKRPGDWIPAVREQYAIYQSAGVDPKRTVTFSAYYEPTIAARLKPDALFRYPIYARPSDLVDVDLGLFEPTLQGMRVAGRRQGAALIPYYTRADIDSTKALNDQGLEIAWTKNPLDILFLQTEGSGWLDIGASTGPVRIRYDGNNGRKYRSVGQYIISSGRIPAKRFNHDVFVRYMEKHPKQRQSLLNVNERYIFFRIDVSTAALDAFGNLEVPLTPGRSIATDPKLFPKGLLAWIDVDASVHRFVANQDEGGAIQGPGRVDFFAGHGPEAEHFATHLWNTGHLYFLVKKKSS